jgi:PAS domain S-box-containing protein
MADEKRKIALCFSNPADRRLVSEHLSAKGYEVIECPGAADTGADLLIMDTAFARRSGRELLGLKKPGGVFLPMVIALGPKDAPAVWLSAGFDLCLHMPFSKAELDAAVQTLLRLRHQSEQLLQKAEDIYQAIFEATGTATLIVEQDGAIVMANKECLAVTGYAPEELIGRKWMEFVSPESLERMLAYHALRRKDPSLAPKKYEAKLIDKKGGPRYAVLDVNMIPGTTRSVVSIMDITERKQAEEALKKSTADLKRLSDEFHALLDAIPDNLTLQSPELKVLWANNGAAVGLNKKPSELIGQHCYELWHNRTAPCDPCPVQKSFRTGEPAAETVTTPDGRIWELRTVPIKEAGRVVNVIEMGRDITEHRKLEAQYLHAQKMEVVGQLAGGVAHDFNNILTAIIGYGSMALMQLPRENPVRRNIENMIEASDRAAKLTKELLLFSRKQVSERRAVDLNDIVIRFEKFLKRVIGEDVELKTSLWGEPLQLLADGQQMEQVLMNMATNARDAMPNGGTFTITTSYVKLDEDFIKRHSYGTKGNYALLTVADTGGGMDKETQKRIFEPFFTTKEVGKGTGLGLAVVYGIIKQHDGFITVYSEPGEGTTFKIYLPLVEVAVPKQVEEIKKEAPAGGKETILLAEDDEMLRQLMVAVLTEYGYSVIEAVDGADAVRKFIENKDRIHLLLFDLIMPKMDGKEAYDEIRKIKPEIKVIFASGYAPSILQQKLQLENQAALISKPMSPEDLLKKLRSVLDGK